MLKENVLKGIIPQDKALQFMTAGNCVVTFKSLLTQNHFTYKLTAISESWINVKMLTGSDNTSNYSDIFILRNSPNEGPKLLINIKSRNLRKDSKGVIAFKFVLMNLILRPELPMTNLEIWHEGRCCRCGRLLTVPESISNGIGPECITKQNIFKI